MKHFFPHKIILPLLMLISVLPLPSHAKELPTTEDLYRADYEDLKEHIKSYYYTGIFPSESARTKYYEISKKFLAETIKREDKKTEILARLNLIMINIYLSDLSEANRGIKILSEMPEDYHFKKANILYLKALLSKEEDDIDAVVEYSQKALDIYEKDGYAGDGLELVKIKYRLSVALSRKGNREESLMLLRECESIAEGLNFNDHMKGVIYHDLGIEFANKSEIALSMDYLFKSIEFLDKDSWWLIASSYSQIAFNKASLGDNKEAINYYLKALPYIEQSKMQKYKASFSELYSNLADAYSLLNQFERADFYIQKAISYDESFSKVKPLTASRINRSFFKNKEGKPEEALEILKKIDKEQLRSWLDRYSYIKIWYHWAKAESNHMLGQHNEARDNILIAVKDAEEFGWEEYSKAIHLLASKIFNSLEDYKNELKHYRIYDKIEDRQFEAKNKTLLMTRELDYERKEKSFLEAESLRVKLSLMIVSGLLMLAVGLTYRLYYVIKKYRSLQAYIQKKVLSRFLPPTIIDEVMEGVSRLDTEPSYEMVTVLFCDIVGFTRMFDSEDSAVATAILNQYLREITDVIYYYNGTIDKFIGDAVMVLFGAPMRISEQMQAERAVECAEAMIVKVDELNKEFQEQYGINLKVRVGINQGEALVGTIGGKQRSDFTAIGHTVNVASRVEGVAKPQQILFTKKVAENLPIGYKSVGHFSLKGIDEDVELFSLEDKSSASDAEVA